MTGQMDGREEGLRLWKHDVQAWLATVLQSWPDKVWRRVEMWTDSSRWCGSANSPRQQKMVIRWGSRFRFDPLDMDDYGRRKTHGSKKERNCGCSSWFNKCVGQKGEVRDGEDQKVWLRCAACAWVGLLIAILNLLSDWPVDQAEERRVKNRCRKCESTRCTSKH